MLIGLGFKPLAAAGLALIGNTAPVAYGALGTPIITLAKVTGLPEMQLSAMVGRQLPFFSVIVPFWLVWAMSGFKGMIEVWPACLVAGVFFAIPQFVVSNYFGPSLVDIVAAIVSIGATYALLKFWQPKKIWRFDEERRPPTPSSRRTPAGAAFMAWMPWIVLSVLVFAWGTPVGEDAALNGIFAPCRSRCPASTTWCRRCRRWSQKPSRRGGQVHLQLALARPARRSCSPASSPACWLGLGPRRPAEDLPVAR